MSPRRQGRRICGVCEATIAPDDEATVMVEVGEVHRDCEADVERAIEDGACSRLEYLRLLGVALHDERDEFPEFGSELGDRRKAG